MKASQRASARREPKQRRSRETVDAVLEAVPRVLRRHGAHAITTNRIAEVAGVSIGSLYEYFPDKQAIFSALHDRHVDAVHEVFAAMSTHGSSFDAWTCELVAQLASVHARDAELHELTSAAVPGSAEGFKRALHAAFERAISPSHQDRYTADEAERMLLVLPHLIEGLVHGVSRQKQGLALGRAKDEAMRTVSLYLRSFSAAPALHY